MKEESREKNVIVIRKKAIDEGEKRSIEWLLHNPQD
jgi:hypothetical protein